MRLTLRGRLLLRTPGPVPFGTCGVCSNIETIFSWTFRTLSFEHPSVLILLHYFSETHGQAVSKAFSAYGDAKALSLGKLGQNALSTAMGGRTAQAGSISLTGHAYSSSHGIHSAQSLSKVMGGFGTSFASSNSKGNAMSHAYHGGYGPAVAVAKGRKRRSSKLIYWPANRGRLLLRTPGPVPFGTCICSYVETILSQTCHVYGPHEFRTSLGTSVLLIKNAVLPQ